MCSKCLDPSQFWTKPALWISWEANWMRNSMEVSHWICNKWFLDCDYIYIHVCVCVLSCLEKPDTYFCYIAYSFAETANFKVQWVCHVLQAPCGQATNICFMLSVLCVSICLDDFFFIRMCFLRRLMVNSCDIQSALSICSSCNL